MIVPPDLRQHMGDQKQTLSYLLLNTLHGKGPDIRMAQGHGAGGVYLMLLS